MKTKQELVKTYFESNNRTEKKLIKEELLSRFGICKVRRSDMASDLELYDKKLKSNKQHNLYMSKKHKRGNTRTSTKESFKNDH